MQQNLSFLHIVKNMAAFIKTICDLIKDTVHMRYRFDRKVCFKAFVYIYKCRKTIFTQSSVPKS